MTDRVKIEVARLREFGPRIAAPWPAEERAWSTLRTRLRPVTRGNALAERFPHAHGRDIEMYAMGDARPMHFTRAADGLLREWHSYGAIRAGARINERGGLDLTAWSATVPPERRAAVNDVLQDVLDSFMRLPATQQGIDAFAHAMHDQLIAQQLTGRHTRRPVAAASGEVTGWEHVQVPDKASPRAVRQIERVDQPRPGEMRAYHPFSWMPSVSGIEPIVLRWATKVVPPPLELWRSYETIRAAISISDGGVSGWRVIAFDYELWEGLGSLAELEAVSVAVGAEGDTLRAAGPVPPADEAQCDAFARGVAARLAAAPWRTRDEIVARLRFDRDRHSGVDPDAWFASVPAEHMQAAIDAFYPAVNAPPPWSTLDELAGAIAQRLEPRPTIIPAATRRLDRRTLGELATRYCPRRPDGSYSRAAARAWLRAFRTTALIAGDALESTCNTTQAVAVLRNMVSEEDAQQLAARPGDQPAAAPPSGRNDTQLGRVNQIKSAAKRSGLPFREFVERVRAITPLTDHVGLAACDQILRGIDKIVRDVDAALPAQPGIPTDATHEQPRGETP